MKITLPAVSSRQALLQPLDTAVNAPFKKWLQDATEVYIADREAEISNLTLMSYLAPTIRQFVYIYLGDGSVLVHLTMLVAMFLIMVTDLVECCRDGMQDSADDC